MRNFQAATALVHLYFIHTALVAPAFELRIEPFADDPECHLLGDRAGADGDAVGIVMLFGELGRPFVPTKSAAHTLHLIGHDGFAITAAAQDNAAIRLPGGHGLGCGANKIGIIAGLCAMTAAVEHAVPACFQQLDDGRLEGEAGMVGADGYGEC